jgi:hypothetical protein
MIHGRHAHDPRQQEGRTLGFSTPQARKLLGLPAEDTIAGCATAPSCRSARRSGCGAPRSPASRSAICTRTAAITRCASCARAAAGDALAINPQTAVIARLSRRRRPAAAAQKQAERCAQTYGPRCDQPRGAQISLCVRVRPRLLGALDARHLHHHGARKRCPAQRRARAAGHHDPSTTKLYDRRGYNPRKMASFFVTY